MTKLFWKYQSLLEKNFYELLYASIYKKVIFPLFIFILKNKCQEKFKER